MKPGATLFAVNSSGQVFALRSDKNHKWTPLPYLGINFKRLTATQNALWALGGDHQIYVCVFGVEIPLRVREETYENQIINSGKKYAIFRLGSVYGFSTDTMRINIIISVSCIRFHFF